MARAVTLVLLDVDGRLLGELPPFEAQYPWWQEVADIVAAARTACGVEIAVLRLLGGRGDGRPAMSGEATYLAQLTAPAPAGLPLRSSAFEATSEPLRMPWASPGGPQASVAWALDALASVGVTGVTPVQQRSWNLSAIWRMHTAHGIAAWLKQVPSFFAHEPRAIELVRAIAPGLAPAVIASDADGRMLLTDVPGDDGYGASVDVRARIAELLHPLQARYAGEYTALRAAGLPDRRLSRERFVEVAAPWEDRIPGIRSLIDDLPARLVGIERCGLPDTVVHGDLHPGNTRIGAGDPVIIDWGDSSICHPALDIMLLTYSLGGADAAAVQSEWAARWRRDAPGSDPLGALELMRPLERWRSAVIMNDFVTNIEPSERIYHADDERDMLAAAVAALG